jgi:hypothetical protein
MQVLHFVAITFLGTVIAHPMATPQALLPSPNLQKRGFSGLLALHGTSGDFNCDGSFSEVEYNDVSDDCFGLVSNKVPVPMYSVYVNSIPLNEGYAVTFYSDNKCNTAIQISTGMCNAGCVEIISSGALSAKIQSAVCPTYPAQLTRRVAIKSP